MNKATDGASLPHLSLENNLRGKDGGLEWLRAPSRIFGATKPNEQISTGSVQATHIYMGQLTEELRQL